ncbi:MAG: hypothetical protein CMJ49_08645 [Planctomycetaceae bacterium]|nr:hypothetical protein [Planctomycetaceae bacterium]
MKAARLNSDWPVLKGYSGKQLGAIAMPMGGIGTGTISLGGYGQLLDFEVGNAPAKGFVPESTFFAVHVSGKGIEATTRCLESAVRPPFDHGGSGHPFANHSLPRFRYGAFDAAYPLAQVRLWDPDMPIEARLEAFNPMVPTDADASGIPVMVLRYVLTNRTSKPVTASVCGSMRNFLGGVWREGEQGGGVAVKGGVNRHRIADGLEGLAMEAAEVDDHDVRFGTVAMTAADTAGALVSHRTSWAADDRMSLLDFWDDFGGNGMLDEARSPEGVDGPVGSLAMRQMIGAGESRAYPFLVTWHFANRQTWTPAEGADCGCDDGGCDEGSGRGVDWVGNYYTGQYSDAWDAAAQTAGRLDDLEKRTVAFVRAFCDSDLPRVVKEAALFNVSTLRTQTTFRIADGHLMAWEGCRDTAGCCYGSCTHVWNYEQTTAHLYGELARTMRDVEFNYATDAETGCMSFRAPLPLDRKWTGWGAGRAAADGQMGCVVKAYREWRLSGDDAGLKAIWPRVRKAVEFAWIEGGWDADRDGVMEGCQHNTMDVEYFGANPQMNVVYLAALRAAALMARHLGEDDFAATCEDLFARGSAWTDEHLFNGEYYQAQDPPAEALSGMAEGLWLDRGPDETGEPDWQIGPGCEVNMLFGQFLAHVSGLGDLLDAKRIESALRAIVRYNFRKDLWGYFNFRRTYALQDEAGLLMCTWPRGGRPRVPYPYGTEVWTGLEYVVATQLVYAGRRGDAMRLVRAARARHDGWRRNPFNEFECGHHYARAMSAWGLVIAMSGFEYSAADGVIGFDAAGKKKKRWFFATGDAWGTVTQRPSAGGIEVELHVMGGEMGLRAITLKGAGTAELEGPRTIRAGDVVDVRIERA